MENKNPIIEVTKVGTLWLSRSDFNKATGENLKGDRIPFDLWWKLSEVRDPATEDAIKIIEWINQELDKS